MRFLSFVAPPAYRRQAIDRGYGEKRMRQIAKAVFFIFSISIAFASLSLIDCPITDSPAFAYTWTATKTYGQYTGEIVIGTLESYTSCETWYADRVLIFGKLYVTPYNTSTYTGGKIELHANTIVIGPSGKIIAAGKGYPGAASVTGGGGGAGGGAMVNDNWGLTPVNGVNGSAGSLGSDGYGFNSTTKGIHSGIAGTAGGKGYKGDEGNWIDPNGYGYGYYPAPAGGTGGGGGSSAAEGTAIDKNGGYNASHGNSTPLTETTTTVLMGSGGASGNSGGGGGGGGGGGRCYYSISDGWGGTFSGYVYGGDGKGGGSGGTGGAGGAGGGAVSLVANNLLDIRGTVDTKGIAGSTGVNGTDGTKGDDAPNASVQYSPSEAHGGAKGMANGGSGGTGSSPVSSGSTDGGGGGGGGAGGAGTVGGGGAGGGVYLECLSYNNLTISGTVDARGANGTSVPSTTSDCQNGGTVKIKYAGSSAPSTGNIYAAKIGSEEKILTIVADSLDLPHSPGNPTPLSSEAQIAIPSTFSWSCSTPIPGRELSYFVYIKKAADSYYSSYDAGTNKFIATTDMYLEKGITYQWYVVAQDTTSYLETTGPVWTFKTIAESGTIKVKTFRSDGFGNFYPVEAPFMISKEGAPVGTYSTDSNGTWETSASLDTYSVTFLDKLGFSTPETQVLTIEADGAEITFTGTYRISDQVAPHWTGGPYFQTIDNATGSVTITWEAAVDPEPAPSGILKYVVHFPGKDNIDVGTNTTCTITGLDDGTYSQIFVKAYDRAYNTVDSPDTGFTINRYAPALTVSIKKGAFERKFTADRLDPPVAVSLGSTINLTAADGNDIASTSIIIKDKSGVTVGTSAATIYTTTLDLSGLPLKENEIYTISAEASDTAGKQTLISVKIQFFPSEVKVVNGDPFNYPNPFDPIKGTTIKYYLSDSSDTKVMVYNSAGKIVFQKLCKAAVDEGGKQDLNLVPWNGKDNFGNYVANGPYFYFIIVDGKVIGKGDMAAFK